MSICRRGPRLLACLAALSVACSSAEPPPRDDLDLRIGFGLSESRERQSAMAVLASHLSSESVLGLESNGRPRPGIAERWDWDAEGRTLVIELRPNVRFHDGEPVTAESVVTALERYRQAARPASVFEHVSSIAVRGENEIAIQLSRPDAFLLAELAQITVVGADGVGTGPFRIASTDPLRLERFEQYHRGSSQIRSIVIQPFDSQRSAWAALLRGEIDAVQGIQPDSVEFMQGSTQVTTSSLVRPFYIMLALNLRHDVLRHTDVRRGIAEAVDRHEIVRTALRGMARVADNPIWPDHWALSSAARRYTHNPEAARLRLEGAGFPMKSADVNGTGRRFSVTCLFWEGEPQYERIALLLQRQLMRVGIDLQLRGVSTNDWVTRIGTGEFEMLLVPARGGRSLHVTYDFWRSPVGGASAHMNIGYTGMDAVLDRLRIARSDTEIRTAVADLQERFYEDAPAVFIAWQETTRAISAHIDVSDRSDPDVFSNIWRWRRAEPGRSP